MIFDDKKYSTAYFDFNTFFPKGCAPLVLIDQLVVITNRQSISVSTVNLAISQVFTGKRTGRSRMLTLVILFVLAVTVYLYITWNNNYWAKKKVPYDEPTFLLGSFKEILNGSKHFGVLYMDLYKYICSPKYLHS